MIRINLLGKKKIKGPLGIDLDDLLAKVGYKGSAQDILQHKDQIVKVGVLILAIYMTSLAPTIWMEQELAKIDADYTQVRSQFEALQKELDSKKIIRTQMNKLQGEEAEVKRQLDIIASLASNRSQVFQTVERVSALLPDQAWIDQFELAENTVKLSGSAWDYTNINDFVRGLSENAQFSVVQLHTITATDVPNPVPGIPKHLQKIKNYSIDFNWRAKPSG